MSNHFDKLFLECDSSKYDDRCGATIWAPSLNDHFVEDRAFSLYAMECEGDTSTRQGKINQVINLLAASTNPNDFVTQCYAYAVADIDSDTFTDTEVDYIQREVARRCR